MKGRNVFSSREAELIRAILRQKISAPSEKQKPFRDRLRSLGFYISDFTKSMEGFAARDFDALVVAKKIIITKEHPRVSDIEPESAPIGSRPKNRSASDETYILDLCDEILGRKCLRQHRFDFLRGDSNRALPVDGYYSDLQLVVEYRERQHTEATPFFDRRLTVSGVSRGIQRKLYDERRRDVLPQHGIALIELSFEQFGHDRSKRLHRVRDTDVFVIQAALKPWIALTSS